MKRHITKRHNGWTLALVLAGALALLAALASCDQISALAGKTTTVDIAYLGHPPVKAVLTDVDPLLAKYGDKVKVNRYDVDTPEGKDFLASKGVADRTVLAIWVNGSLDYQAGDKQVKFFSFPVGRGTDMTAAGNWDLPDLQAALSAATGVKP
jgi:hypothetical protein